jgi:nucleotide-binding universal stress UspA family protein
MQKKILVAVDGSVYSSNSLDYLIRLFKTDAETAIHLLSVVSAGSSDQNWMLDVDPLRADTPVVELRKAKAEKYLKDARDRLIRNGFKEEQIEYSVVSSAASFAVSIHHFANQGIFDGLLVGRRGVGKMGEMFLGSVSGDLMKQCHEVPLWIIDGEVTSTSFLLAVHSRPESLMAADHLAFMMQNNLDTRIYLYHSDAAFGSTKVSPPEEFHKRWGEQWCRQYLDLDNHLYRAHERILVENGIEAEQITTIEPHMDLDAGHDLMRQAKKHACGTIVIGRRGREAEKGLLGGVSDRTTQQAEDMAVWLVG